MHLFSKITCCTRGLSMCQSRIPKIWLIESTNRTWKPTGSFHWTWTRYRCSSEHSRRSISDKRGQVSIKCGRHRNGTVGLKRREIYRARLPRRPITLQRSPVVHTKWCQQFMRWEGKERLCLICMWVIMGSWSVPFETGCAHGKGMTKWPTITIRRSICFPIGLSRWS